MRTQRQKDRQRQTEADRQRQRQRQTDIQAWQIVTFHNFAIAPKMNK
jgi:hypothetical protein